MHRRKTGLLATAVVGIVLSCVTLIRANGELTVALPGGASMEMVWIEPGTFTMGSPDADTGRDEDEGPQHQVTITRGFYVGKYEVTQEQWTSVMDTAPWAGQAYVVDGADHPATYISWDDAQELVGKLNDAGSVRVWRLPKEAEWEYACRAGTTTWWSYGEDTVPADSPLQYYAWYYSNAWGIGETHAFRVGTRLPNPWGIYDMHGNVWEWCQDWYGSYPISAQTDPVGPNAGTDRVIRGGGFDDRARGVRSSNRYYDPPSLRHYLLGLRLLRDGSADQVITGVVAQTVPVIPGSFLIYPSYPNPFNAATNVRFEVPETSRIELAVYDVLGRRVRKLVDGEVPMGTRLVVWDGRDDAGVCLGSGVYYSLLRANRFGQARRMVLIR